jgi:hypothetical protein
MRRAAAKPACPLELSNGNWLSGPLRRDIQDSSEMEVVIAAKPLARIRPEEPT